MNKFLKLLGLDLVAIPLIKGLSREEFYKSAGFLVIVDSKKGKSELYLRTRGGLVDGQGRFFPDNRLAWSDYDKTWQAFTLGGVNGDGLHVHP